jgi:RNA polymerase sigma-70 factor (sigma-E family)
VTRVNVAGSRRNLAEGNQAPRPTARLAAQTPSGADAREGPVAPGAAAAPAGSSGASAAAAASGDSSGASAAAVTAGGGALAPPTGTATRLGPRDTEAVIQDLYRAHALTLVRMAKLLLRDQQSAEDVVQESFIALYRALPRLSDHGQLLPYLRAAVINRSRSVLRARGRAAARPTLHDPPAASAESAALASESQRAVMAAITRLPRRAREVVVLRYYLDLADHEIAATLGVSRGTVSSTASRAVAAIARDLEEEL